MSITRIFALALEALQRLSMNSPLLRKGLIIVAMVTAYNLVGAAFHFSGTRWGWTALILNIVALTASLIWLAVTSLRRPLRKVRVEPGDRRLRQQNECE